ncbi:MAG: DUF2760 domain-containing protein [Deltaproteobacteria bacterium]|nr:DUF2760 domain-containing protein [Deltaproteobacteria bacterium]
MTPKQVFSRRFYWIVFFILLPYALILYGAGFLAIHWLRQASVNLPSASPETADKFSAAISSFETDFILYGTPTAVVLFLILTLLIWKSSRSVFDKATRLAPGSKKVKEIKPASARGEKREHDRRMFLYLLSVFQREGRLMDFLAEDLSLYEDAQIGATVRSIHESCKKVVNKTLMPKPVIDKPEGESVIIDPGFDPSCIKLVGNVSGDPPFSGVLRHPGWQVKRPELPTLSGKQNASIIAPAEVEIS